jgi:hypothetical protein
VHGRPGRVPQVELRLRPCGRGPAAHRATQSGPAGRRCRVRLRGYAVSRSPPS